jgi:alanine dehydrogenase
VVGGIYNMLGQQIRTLQSGFQLAGAHRIQWDASDDTGIRAGLNVVRGHVIHAGVAEAFDMELTPFEALL